LAALALGIACGGAKSTTLEVPGASIPKKASVTPSVTGHIVTSIDERAIGPFFAKLPGGAALATWVTGAEGNDRRVIAVPLDPNGERRGPDKTLALVGIETNMLVVRPSRGPSPGFVVAWTTLADRGDSLWVMAVGADGVPRGKPVELAHTNDDVIWVDIVPTDAGATCLWVEETHDGKANMVAAALNADGTVHDAPPHVARGITGWHVVELPGGVGLSTVSAQASADAGRGGVLTFVRLDAEARPVGAPVTIADKPTVSGDVEVARIVHGAFGAVGPPGGGTSGTRLLFAWTDRTTDEPFVAAASLDEHGVLAPARSVVEAPGGAALLGVASGPAGAALMWESPTRRIGDVRHMHVAHIDARGLPDGVPLSLETQGRALPELTAAGSGFAILATLQDCDRGSAACADAAFVPTLLRTDARVTGLQREPLTFGSDPASFAWGATCNDDGCLALAASGNAPARIRVAEVRPRTNMQPAPEQKLPAQGSRQDSRVADLTAVIAGETVVDFATTHLGNVTVLATLATSPKPQAGKGHGDDSRSLLTLATRTIDAAGIASAPIVFSTRALAAGGVALAPGGKPEDGGAVAWVASDGGDPEVHVARIDRSGKRTNDVQLTKTKGDASDVTITWAGSGWIVAWVDGRDGNGEVYATKVGLDLHRVAREERITKAPGDASDLVALARGDLVWLAWADPRERPKDGIADIFACAIGARDAKRVIDEQRILATAAHSRTPALAPADDGVQVAWIEEAPLGVQTPNSSGYGAMWATLDSAGRLVRRPIKLPFAGEGAATSVALDASTPNLHAIVARSTQDSVALDAVDLSSAPPQAFPLLTLDGPPSLDVAIVLEGDILYFNDQGSRDVDRRVRRAKIVWR